MQYYTIPEVAKLLKLHPDTVRRMLKRGELRARRFGNRLRIPESELDGTDLVPVDWRQAV